MKKLIFVFLIISTVFLLLAGCGNGKTQEQTTIDISEIETQSIGEEVVVGDVIWKVN